jgi:D-serine deaminase-like pyridoxal phosphate-dependent protein
MAGSKYKSDLDTPCLMLDMDILEKNLNRMQTIVSAGGKNLRPHAKTHKCSALAKSQIDHGAAGICAAKLSEAETLAASGIENILITSPVVSEHKIKCLSALVSRLPSILVVVDNSENIDRLETVLGEAGLVLDLLIDIDVGLHRTGVTPGNTKKLAEHIGSKPHLRLRGIQAYAGHVQHIKSYDERTKTSIHCLETAAAAYRDLQSNAPDIDIFSASGTGTFDIDLSIAALTELQTGSYVCMDAEYCGIGSADDPARFYSFPPALRLLTTVISTNHSELVTVDAGLKSLYKDGEKPIVVSPENTGWEYDWFGDEHGKITGNGTGALPPLGTVLELVTSHCDPTVNLFDRYFLTRGDEVVGSWPIDLRGCSR